MKVTTQQAFAAKAWPFEEARKLLARAEARKAAGKPVKGVLFETGYGPSGLPHIGTFGEVARTSWVRHAFEAISDVPTHLIAFSDDMDGLRKVPGNLPQQEMLAANLGKPLTAIPDPFGSHESFGHHMNARLRSFLDSYGFRNVGFIKIDVEGSEIEVIAGARKIISRDRPNMLIELLAGIYGDVAARIENIKTAFGYDAWIVIGREKVDAQLVLAESPIARKTSNVLFTPKQTSGPCA